MLMVEAGIYGIASPGLLGAVVEEDDAVGLISAA
jgi:hypothetical protein